MKYDKLKWLFENDITVRLIRADNAPLIISFLYHSFKQQNRITYPEKELESLLGDSLFGLNQAETLYPSTPKAYLKKWTEQGFLRRYYESDDDPVIDLTPSAENAIKWMEELGKQEFVGTESRLLHFFSILRELVLKTNTNVEERVDELKDRQRQVDIELIKANQGNIEVFDDTKIRERFIYAEETAKRLLADFRQVEQNFRDLDKEIRERIIKSSVSKGRLLDDIFNEQDYVWSTDQGKSFRAFWEFLMSDQKQTELEQLIKAILVLPQVEKLRGQSTINRIKNNLIDAGEKVNRTNDSLIEQLRKFVEQKSLLESRRLLSSIEEIEKILVENKDNGALHQKQFELDGIFKAHFFMGRVPFTPPFQVKFEANVNEPGVEGEISDILFDQFYIDPDTLKKNIANMLKHSQQVSLKEITDQYSITRGISEVVAYYQIASKEKKHFVNADFEEELVIHNYRAGKMFQIKLPQLIFNR
ncbi:MAG: DUF3375 domain-containing protein [Chryseolinea sp.]